MKGSTKNMSLKQTQEGQILSRILTGLEDDPAWLTQHPDSLYSLDVVDVSVAFLERAVLRVQREKPSSQRQVVRLQRIATRLSCRASCKK